MPITIKPDGNGMEKVTLVGDDGQELSWLIMFCQKIHIGRAIVRAGIVGHVFTPEEHRKKGYGNAVMTATLDEMAKRGYEIAFLFGIPYYYIKLGYAVVEHYYATALKFSQVAIGAVSGMKAEKYGPADLSAVMKLYNSYVSRRTGGFVRDRAIWDMEPTRKALENCLCIKTADGKLAGYARMGGTFFYTRLIAQDCMESMLLVHEAVAANEKTAKAMLSALAESAKAQGKAGILFLGPPDNELARVMYEVGGQHRRAIMPEGGAQGRAICLLPLMEKLRSDFTDRCKDTIFQSKAAKIRVSTEMGIFDITVNKGKVDVSAGRGGKADWKLSAQELIQYIFGYCPPPDLAGEKGLFVKTLFPQQIGHSWPADEMI